MKQKINIGALVFAGLMFYQSTAFGFEVLLTHDLIKEKTVEKSYFFSLIKESSELNAETPRVNNAPFSKSENDAPTENTVAVPAPNGGPDQPEVQSFTPIGTSDMVDPFTGDFSYNIPLMDIDGYPLNIAYSAGVTMDQEASWVGLGWNLNPGVISRMMRGLPDEFNGEDEVVKEMNVKKNWTVGGSIGASFELFGFDPLNLEASLGINYNNYSGYSSSISIKPTLGISSSSNQNFVVGLGFSGSSSGGASLNPSLSISKKAKDGSDNENTVNKINIGSQINSRAGFTGATISYARTKDVAFRNGKTVMVTEKGKDGKKRSTEVSKMTRTTLPISSTFNFGQSTYTPQISLPFNSGGGTFSFNLGPDIVGFDAHVLLSGFYNAQWLKTNSISSAAYGYMNLHKGQKNKDALLDFNRENDGPFTKNTPALPIPNVTYDIYSVSGQGIAGSYRPVRNDIGHVFDQKMVNNSLNGSLGLEAGLGATFKGGIDIALTYSNSASGDWTAFTNGANRTFNYSNSGFYFREANEMAIDLNTSQFNKIGGYDPVYFPVTTHTSVANKLAFNSGDKISNISNVKNDRKIRNQVVYTLSNSELKSGMGIEPLPENSRPMQTGDALNHHIGQFTVLNVEGARYVYGIPAYSYKQKNVSFAVGVSTDDDVVISEPDCSRRTIDYSPGSDNSINNNKGLDNYYSALTTPAFAHSYLLTTVLNADYVDADDIKGPSKGDLGGYMSFSYKKVENYKWRNPVEQNVASFDYGLNTDNTDDKAHYLYGEKELWYVDTIQSKNHIAIFHSSERDDGVSVHSENGGLNSSGARMMKLDSIQLFSLPEFIIDPENAVSLKTVHFRYDYSLCPNYEGNINGEGKLTLKQVFFTYQGSNKGRYTPYVFEYGQRFEDGVVTEEINPDYNVKSIDRWNCFKEPVNCTGDINVDPLNQNDFPYVGFDKEQVDKNVTAWNLSTIDLPSGGKIQVDYESDDYAFVQHKQANQMFRIIGVENTTDPSIIQTSDQAPISDDDNKNAAIYIELMPDPTSSSGYNENISDYVKPGQQIYFRALMDFNGGQDFVPGYAKVTDNLAIVNIGNQKALKIVLKGDKLLDNGNADYNPIAVAAIQFARLHLSKFIPPSNNSGLDESANLPGLLDGLAGAITSFGEIFVGPNKPLWNQSIGTNMVIGKSWVRLLNPDKKKLGGGHRVKQIRIYDAWDELTQNEMEGYFYGQDYSYKLNDETEASSGVASYEPQIGGDENPFKQPVANNTRNLLAPDTRNYQETPFGEQFFPSASVGYSRVTVKDIEREGVSRTATGKVVHEFYTAKEYPTIVRRTKVDLKRLKIPVIAIFFSLMIDEMTASQGFVVENNNMHGKEKRQSVYAEGKSEPITMVKYEYQNQPFVVSYSQVGLSPDDISTKRLVNDVKAIQKNGEVTTSTMGVTYEAVADFRKSTSNTIGGALEMNINFTAPVFLFPTISGSGSYERTAFRSTTFTKVIERFGIQNKTIAKDLGSVVETNNLAYDAETGTVLLTETHTNFNDKIYNFSYPAHWFYDEMGQAYKNVGLTRSSLIGFNFTNGATSVFTHQHFAPGDEVAFRLVGNSSVQLGWVTEANSSGIRVLLKDGTPLNGQVGLIKILRSGRRNIQITPIGSVILRGNPLDNLQGNIFEHVLQAGATEFNDEWRTFCECFVTEDSDVYTTNPYVLGTKGVWRPVASYLHLSGRNQTYENGNSNIRDDGFFTSFSPFYKLNNGVWEIDKNNWTFTSSVVEYSPFGQPLETIDALDRYSASMYGYNQTLPLAVAANTRYRQLGFDGFEDYNYDNCSDDHFRVAEGLVIEQNEAHTGRRSLKVSAGQPVVFSNSLIDECDASCFSCDSLDCSDSGVIYIVEVFQASNETYTFTYPNCNGETETVEVESSRLGQTFQICTKPGSGNNFSPDDDLAAYVENLDFAYFEVTETEECCECSDE